MAIMTPENGLSQVLIISLKILIIFLNLGSQKDLTRFRCIMN